MKKRSKNKLNRSSKHSIKNANFGKRNSLKEFLADYLIALQVYIDFIWENEIYIDGKLVLDIKNDVLNNISFIDYNLVNTGTRLFARALSSAATQACNEISKVIKTRARYLYAINNYNLEPKVLNYIKKKLDKIKISKPIIKNIKASLSSKNVEIKFNETSFGCFVILKCLGKEFGHIRIPIKQNYIDYKWKKKGKLLGGIRVSENGIEFVYEVDKPKEKIEGSIIGIDTGVNNVITTSDKQQVINQIDRHNHSMKSIMGSLSRKKKGSKAWNRKAKHRENFINWSVNQLNLANVKQINVEHISNLGYKKNLSSLMKRFTHAKIEEKLLRLSEENGVRVIRKTSTCKSQRCSSCGWVYYKNRKAAVFCCHHCGFVEDADFNAATNNSIDLPEIPKDMVFKKANREGFFWNPSGITFKSQEEHRAPDAQQ